MAVHSVADAKNHLSALIDRAIEGEEVVITRHGTPVAMLKGVAPQRGPITEEEIAWLARHRVGGAETRENAGVLLSRMRDDDWR
ncbi:MAG: type II toxin-antitoxin system Phd/YefM family antitoxin [Caulobacteraceae bacterium]